MLPPVSHGRSLWPLALTEGRKLRMFENGMLRGIFRCKRDEVTGGWRRAYS
jgi:hypothetical protein